MRFRASTIAAVVVVVLSASFQARAIGASTTKTPEADGESFSFVDKDIISSERGVLRTLHPGHQLSIPVLEAQEPWESKRINIETVLYDAQSGRFRMWYTSHLSNLKNIQDRLVPRLRNNNGCLVLYATSKDGIHWNRPNLGLYRFDGSAQNNIVYDMDSSSVIFDPQDADPAKRYKMLGYRHGDKSGYYAAFSADGIHWADYPKNPVLEFGDTIRAVRDPLTGRYFAFHKRPLNAGGDHDPLGGINKRVVWLSTSPDFQDWTKPQLVLAPDKEDDTWVLGPDQRTEFYDMSGFPYGRGFLGLLAVLQVTQVQKKSAINAENQSPVDGPVDIQLVYSRDGVEWKRFPDRCPIISHGKTGNFDGGMILFVANTPVVYNDQTLVYYTGFKTTHGGSMPPKRADVGLASWRLDGFVSLDGGSYGGEVETVPLSVSGNQLEINVDASHGSACAELLSEDGKVLPGYSMEDCVPVVSDEVHHVIHWKGKDALPNGHPLRFRFRLRDASLYSFRILSSQ